MTRLSYFIILILLTSCPRAKSQASYTIRILSWNVLNYPSSGSTTSDTSFRNPYFREVVQYINPDIFMITELATTSGYSMFLNSVMNASGIGQFSVGTFINGPDSDNAIYYRTSDFQFISNNPIQTALRDISEFTLVHNATGDTIRIYGCHLKASSGISNELARADEVDSLRKVTNTLPAGSDFIVCGDFNMYGEYEQAYYNLTVDNVTDDGNFIDPIFIPGIWNQPLYSDYHTQSTRYGSIGGGAPGGMNDRFDMILYSNAIVQPGRITYISNSFTNVGNDGMHYNQSINVMPNTAVPQNIADALYWTSDHVPVYADFEFASTTGIAEQALGKLEIEIFPNPARDYFEFRISSRDFGIELNKKYYLKIRDVFGSEIFNSQIMNSHSRINISTFIPGIYFLSFTAGDILLTRKIIITQ